MNTADYITKKYGKENLRLYYRFHKMGVPEIYWENSNKVINEKAKKIVDKIKNENLICVGVMTEEKQYTDRLVAEIIKLFTLESITKLNWFDVFLSEHYDKWNGVFAHDKMNDLYNKSAIGIMGVTYRMPEHNEKSILLSFSKFINSITKTGFITRVILGLDLMQKDDVAKFYGAEFDSVLDKKIIIKVN